MWTLSCSTWDLIPWPGFEPRPPSLGVQSLSHWTTREVPARTLLFSLHQGRADIRNRKSISSFCASDHTGQPVWRCDQCRAQGTAPRRPLGRMLCSGCPEILNNFSFESVTCKPDHRTVERAPGAWSRDSCASCPHCVWLGIPTAHPYVPWCHSPCNLPLPVLWSASSLHTWCGPGHRCRHWGCQGWVCPPHGIWGWDSRKLPFGPRLRVPIWRVSCPLIQRLSVHVCTSMKVAIPRGSAVCCGRALWALGKGTLTFPTPAQLGVFILHGFWQVL